MSLLDRLSHGVDSLLVSDDEFAALLELIKAVLYLYLQGRRRHLIFGFDKCGQFNNHVVSTEFAPARYLVPKFVVDGGGCHSPNTPVMDANSGRAKSLYSFRVLFF
ncbi:hypothetical protein LOK49_LG04G02088 [Camellia lanceoleosa]|uniref:Uncharacterized protein n=1 Tax=Camellia lanceoleosa TaxID=1840588 RepID=A0ACC0I1Y7_9ERIC|nr:hypothetical protein LOK49_LG04G02088 [Camellia lanceoleosa]